MFAKAVRQSPHCLNFVDPLTERTGYAIGDSCGDACKVVIDFGGSIGSRDLNYVRNKGTSFASPYVCVYILRFLAAWRTYLLS